MKIFEVHPLKAEEDQDGPKAQKSKEQDVLTILYVLSKNNNFKPLSGLFYPQIPVKSQLFLCLASCCLKSCGRRAKREIKIRDKNIKQTRAQQNKFQ